MSHSTRSKKIMTAEQQQNVKHTGSGTFLGDANCISEPQHEVVLMISSEKKNIANKRNLMF